MQQLQTYANIQKRLTSKPLACYQELYSITCSIPFTIWPRNSLPDPISPFQSNYPAEHKPGLRMKQLFTCWHQSKHILNQQVNWIHGNSSKSNSQSDRHRPRQKHNVTKQAVNIADELPSYLPNKLHDSKIAVLNTTITSATRIERGFRFVRLHHCRQQSTKTPHRRRRHASHHGERFLWETCNCNKR